MRAESWPWWFPYTQRRADLWTDLPHTDRPPFSLCGNEFQDDYGRVGYYDPKRVRGFLGGCWLDVIALQVPELLATHGIPLIVGALPATKHDTPPAPFQGYPPRSADEISCRRAAGRPGLEGRSGRITGICESMGGRSRFQAACCNP